MAEARDVVPDLHADIARLERTLAALDGTAPLAFLGDLIDAGATDGAPDDAAVLARVRALTGTGRAVAVMGNHELNAILYHAEGPDGRPLRAHDAKNRRQHASFLDAFGTGTPAAREWTEWFLTLPLWLDLGGLRLVHACWSPADIALIAARRPDGRLRPADLPEVADEASPLGRAVRVLLTGPELPLPRGRSFTDRSGHRRGHARIAWWREDARSWRDLALSVPDPDALPEGGPPPGEAPPLYDAPPPVLVGHYKMAGPPRLESRYAACLDYPSTPCAYRWRGEAELAAAHLLRP